MDYINNNQKPLIFIGSNAVMGKLLDICDEHGILVAGIIDNDYYGNQDSVNGVPVIDTEHSFNNLEKLNYYKDSFNFFCATNWTPLNDCVSVNNRDKRQRLLDTIKRHGLNCISLVSKSASVSSRSQIGRGSLIDVLAVIEPGVIVGNFTNIYAQALVGHGMKIGENCVIQRKSLVAQDSIVEDQCFFGPCVVAIKSKVIFRKNTFIQEGIYIKRGTVEDEIVTPKSKPRIGSLIR
jgi:hypothetical protein